MTKRAIIAELDNLLVPGDFLRRGVTWNRHVGDLTDVVDIRTDRMNTEATVNVGVLDRGVHMTCWGTSPSEFVEEQTCTVRTRLGHLVDGKDRWWPIHEEGAIADVGQLVGDHALPFLDRMHDAEAMKQFLLDAKVLEKDYPLPIIYLAILQHRTGEISQSCAILAELQTTAEGGWRMRAAETGDRLQCGRVAQR